MYAFIQDVPIEDAVYRQISEKIGDQPPDGQLVHLVLRRPEGGLRYVDVWESAQAYARAVEDVIHPAVHATLQDSGIRPQGEPATTQFEVVELVGQLTTSRT
jgi:hypothetical protein